MPSTAEATQVGKREDLSDVIAVADQKDTPFSTRIKKGKKPGNTLFSWQADGFEDPRNEGVPDGKDADSHEDAARKRKRLYGRVQHQWRTPKVNNLAEDVSTVAGVPEKEFAKAKVKKTIELKRDIELTYLSDADSAEDDGVAGYKTRGMGAWLDATLQIDTPTIVPVDYQTPAGSIYSGTLAAYDENALRAQLQSRWGQTGATNELVYFVGAGIKNAITDFTRFEPDVAGKTHVRHFNMTGDSGTVDTSVDLYKGDYGTVEVVLCSFMPNANRGYILDMNLVESRIHTAPGFKPLPDLGGGPRGIIDVITALACTNPLAHCLTKAT